jgi:tryptophanyl-tRNA synthetase
VTDSRGPGVRKDTDGSVIFTIYQAFANQHETQLFRQELEDGLAWGEAKARLSKLVAFQLDAARDKYFDLMSKPSHVEEILRAGGQKARSLAMPFVAKLREAVGLRSLNSSSFQKQGEGTLQLRSMPPLKIIGPYPFNPRDTTSNVWCFRVDEGKQTRLLSEVATTREQAGALIKRLRGTDPNLLDFHLEQEPENNFFEVGLYFDGEKVATGGGYPTPAIAEEEITKLRAGLKDLFGT